jgi:uncharacterized protein YlxW (UPF0749 family)
MSYNFFCIYFYDTYVEDSDRNVLVLKKNLRSWDDSVIVRVEHYWEAEDKAVGKLQVVGDGLVVTLLHESRKRREATYVRGAVQGRGYSRLWCDCFISF